MLDRCRIDGCAAAEHNANGRAIGDVMNRFVLIVAATVSLALATVTLASTTTASGHGRNFTAHLSGAEEVPAVETLATGQAVFQVERDGTALRYRLIVANVEDVLQAHIHLAPAGQNGGVVAFLYPPGPPPQLIPERTDGVLQTGTITADDLRGGLAGASLDDLLEEIRSGDAYVNVHTTANPGGEIRGQID